MKFIDLTQTFTDHTPVFPADPVPVLTQRGFLERDGFSDWHLSTGMHVGTHIDGPLHMIPNGKRLDEFDVSVFFGAGAVIDARGQTKIGVELLAKTSFNKIKAVLFLTGWSKMYRQEAYYREYPVLTTEAAEFLVSQGVQMVGLDGPSPDQPPFPVHKILLKNDILILENLCNLESLTIAKNFEVTALPIKITADSALARVVAKIV